MSGIEVVDVAHAIQLAIAPVSMVSLVVALTAFLLDVRIAIAVLRIGSW